MMSRLLFGSRPLYACAAALAVTFSLTGCGGSSSSSPSVNNPASGVPSNAMLRTTSLMTAHGLYALGGGLLLYSDVPTSNAPMIASGNSTSRNSRLFHLPGLNVAASSPRTAAALNSVAPLNLFYSTTRSGQNFQFNFFSDAAGSVPAGSAPIVLPASFTTFPYTTDVKFNLTAGNFPGSGAATIVNTSASDFTISGSLHLINDKADTQFNIGSATDASSVTTFFGTFLVDLGNSQNIRVNNIKLVNDAKGNVQLGATVTLNPTQSAAFTGPLVSTSTGLTLKLTSGTQVMNATLTSIDANGNLIPHPSLHIVYPDGTAEDITDAITKPVQ